MKRKLLSVALFSLALPVLAQDVSYDEQGRITSAGGWHFYYDSPSSESFSHVWSAELGNRWIRIPTNKDEWDGMVDELQRKGDKSVAVLRALCPKPRALSKEAGQERANCGTPVAGFFNPFEGIVPAFGVSVGDDTYLPNPSFFTPNFSVTLSAPAGAVDPAPVGEIPQPSRPVPVETRVDAMERRLACKEACSLDMGVRTVACGVLGAMTARVGAIACGAVSFYQMQRCSSKCF